MNTLTPEKPQTETTAQSRPVTIVKLTANNFTVLRALEIVPNKSQITLTGKNEQGKSSVLNAILAVLRGKSAMPEQPIRRGASKAEVEIDMGEFVATLRINTVSGSKLTLRSKNGQDISSPATLLASHSNEILLDPVGFVRLGEKPDGRRKQAEMFRRLLGLDFTKLDSDKAQAYADRTLAGRDADLAKGKLANFAFDATAPAQEVLSSELLSALQAIQNEGDATLAAAQEHNKENQKVKDRWIGTSKLANELDAQIQSAADDVDRLEAALKEAKKNLRALVDDGDRIKKELADQEKAVAALIYNDEDIIRSAIALAKKPIEERINQADEINQKVRGNRRHLEIKEEIKTAQTKVETLTTAIDKIEKDKEQQLANAPLPMPNLKFDDSGIIYDGLPLSQASTARQLKVAIAIGFAMKPKIRVVLFRDWSLLDQESQAEVAAMVEKEEGQVWAEEVESDNPSAIEIVSGEIRE